VGLLSWRIVNTQSKHKRYVALYVDSTKTWVLDSKGETMEPLECLKLDLPRPETIITEEEWERAKKEIDAKMEIFDMECKMALGRAISSARDSYVC